MLLVGPCVFLATTGRAELIVNEDLGVLPPGTRNLVGSTANGANNADYYVNTLAPQGNWGNEYVYQFRLEHSGLVGLTLNETDGDPDFILLDGLTTTPAGGKNVAQNDLDTLFLDDPLPDSGFFGLLAPGTYYLSVDAFSDFDPPPSAPASAAFNLGLTISDVELPAAAIDLGALALPGEPFTIDTLGSDFDTVVGLYDSAGGLLEVSDDIDDTTLQSRLDFSAGLSSGEFFLGLAGFETDYRDGFIIRPAVDSEGGNYVLNFPGGPRSGVLATGEAQLFRFEVVVPEPSTWLLLAIGTSVLLSKAKRRQATRV
jgi:hypothetical protein